MSLWGPFPMEAMHLPNHRESDPLWAEGRWGGGGGTDSRKKSRKEETPGVSTQRWTLTRANATFRDFPSGQAPSLTTLFLQEPLLFSTALFISSLVHGRECGEMVKFLS